MHFLTPLRRWIVHGVGVALLAASAAQAQVPAAAASEASIEVLPAANPVSAAGQRVYEQARMRLVQVRTLLRAQDSQSSVGSGFLVSDQGHLITNYHVVSQFAMQPQRHRLVYATADGRQGALQLLAIDVVHDLALVRMVEPGAAAGRGALVLRSAAQALVRGERIYAMGNPLDVGFAVLEGSYNGLVERAFVPNIFFGGSLSGGMSGGPALDEQGRVMGINVASRRDGEQVSFLVPAPFAQALLERGRNAAPITQAVYPTLAKQLLAHQDDLTQRFLAQPWRSAGHERYRIPVPQETYMRCWGRSNAAESKGLAFERSDCQMDSHIYVSGSLQTGYLSARHEAYDGRKLGWLRFAQRYSASFGNENFGGKSRWQTVPQCHQRFVDREGLALRAVMCLRAHKKLEGLYDMGVMVATLDANTQGVQGRFDAYGVSFDNALRLASHYLDGYAWTTPRTASR